MRNKIYGVNLLNFNKLTNTSYVQNYELNIQEFDNGFILPLQKINHYLPSHIWQGGVCDSDFNFVAGYKRRIDIPAVNWECVQSYRPDYFDVVNEEVIFAGIVFDHFGHFLTESFSRLWYIAKYQEKISDKKVVFLTMSDKELPDYVFKLLESLKLKRENIIFLDKPTQFKKIFVPDQSLYFYNKVHPEFLLPYQMIVDNVSKLGIKGNKNKKKLYLSRQKYSKDTINEIYFERFYSNLGYDIIYPEQLDILEQIYLIAHADEIVSTIGTLTHLALFAKKGIRFIQLLRTREGIFIYVPQEMINQLKKLDYTYVDVSCNFLPSRHNSYCFYVGPTASWCQFVQDAYNIKINENLMSYLNSDKANLGLYLNQWLSAFSNSVEMNKIKDTNIFQIYETLEIMLSNETDAFETKGKGLHTFLNSDNNNRIYQMIADKSFAFSRLNGSHKRIFQLKSDGSIIDYDGVGNRNEKFWEIDGNELVLKNEYGKITSRFFYVDIKNNQVIANGYYLPNRSIQFKLTEIMPQE